jgi:hypothetical protein
MARRYNHYEAAFEDYVRSKGWPYVAVDEKKKAIFAGNRIKSFDFIVYPPEHKPRLVDVKGRKFPYEGRSGRRFWENWVTSEDLTGLGCWDGVFGDGFESGLMFAYWLTDPSIDPPANDIHVFRGREYVFLWVSAADYGAQARRRSPKWDTVTVPARDFRRLTRSAAG